MQVVSLHFIHRIEAMNLRPKIISVRSRLQTYISCILRQINVPIISKTPVSKGF